MEEEYQRIVEKDKSLGKDFNKAAYEHLKLQKYQFQYLRMQEKMYNYEQLKKGEKVLPHQEEAAAASTSLYHFEDNTPPIET